MRIKETKVYTFAELSPAAQEKARDWYREALAEDTFWSESVIESAQTAGTLLGITFDTARGRRSQPAIYWSGFSSQGDGACFVGSWRAGDVKPGQLAAEFTGDGASNVELRRIAAEFERISAAYPDASFTVTHRGHYSHEGCTEFETECGGDETAPAHVLMGMEHGDTDGEEAVLAAWREAFPADDLTEAARDFMCWIYRSLEAEYEHQNADAQVDEAITTNEYEFTEAGERA